MNPDWRFDQWPCDSEPLLLHRRVLAASDENTGSREGLKRGSSCGSRGQKKVFGRRVVFFCKWIQSLVSGGPIMGKDVKFALSLVLDGGLSSAV